MIAALVRHLVESTLFAAIVAAFPFLMRRRSAASRHLVWLLAASKFALPAALFSFVGLELRGLYPAHRFLFETPTGLSSFAPLQAPAASTAPDSGVLPILLIAVWGCGAVVTLVAWLLRMRAPRGTLLEPSESENKTLDELARRLGVRGHLVLRTTRERIEPGVSGVFRHTITVPEGLSGELEPGEFEAVLLHELAHAKRHDNLTAGWVHLLACLFWFHPMLWWIKRRLIAEQELACDEIALQYGAGPDEFASGILKVCQFHLARAVVGACGISGSSLKNRLEAIMSFQPNRRIDRSQRVLVPALVLIMIVVPFVFGFLASPPGYALGAKHEGHVSTPAASRNPITCLHTDGKYPVGSVVEVGGVGVRQMCVETMQGRALWVRTFNDAARDRSGKVIFIPPQPRVTCQPAPFGSGKLCGCRTSKGLVLMSPGIIVESANGGYLRCRLDGQGTWRAATPAERGIRGKK